MKNFIYSCLNNLFIAIVFILAVKICNYNVVYGVIAFVVAFACLDLHSYIDKKLNYPNNIFIKS